jgi:DMSO/TMAO reductase YedYZ molybdopterin-dependent catalytic subunit
VTLPPGQRAISFFPRFGVPAYANRVPVVPEIELKIGGDLAEPVTLRRGDLETLPRKEITADFHCVTTWTRQGLRWEGWAFRDVHAAFIAPRLRATDAAYLELFALDGYRTSLLLEDALHANVLLVDRLDGAPLPVEHGAPMRLVAPDLYGYKSVKHLARIEPRRDFRGGLADRQTRAHPRGRVAFEERGRLLPGWFYRYFYRALFPPTLWYYRRMAKRPPTTRQFTAKQ